MYVSLIRSLSSSEKSPAAFFDGGKADTVAFRADMDALLKAVEEILGGDFLGGNFFWEVSP